MTASSSSSTLTQRTQIDSQPTSEVALLKVGVNGTTQADTGRLRGSSLTVKFDLGRPRPYIRGSSVSGFRCRHLDYVLPLRALEPEEFVEVLWRAVNGIHANGRHAFFCLMAPFFGECTNDLQR